MTNNAIITPKTKGVEMLDKIIGWVSIGLSSGLLIALIVMLLISPVEPMLIARAAIVIPFGLIFGLRSLRRSRRNKLE